MGDNITGANVRPLKPEELGFHLPKSGYTFDDAVSQDIVFAEPLLDGVIDVGEVAFVYGESGCMKSFVAADIAFHVAIGRDWCGFQCGGKKRGVLIVLGEGQAGYRKRIKALKNRHQVSGVPIFVVPEPVALDNEAGKLAVWLDEAEKILGLRIELVVFDTFSLMLGDGEENSNRDITIAGNNVRLALDGRSGLAIHHTGHGDKTRERGAYQIRANADVRILVSRDEDNKGKVVTVENVKQKDKEPFQSFNMTFNQVEVGERNGKPVTSLVMVHTDMEPVKTEAKRDGRPLSFVQDAIRTTGSNQKETVRVQFYALYPVKNSDADPEGKRKNDEVRRRAFGRGWKEYVAIAASGTVE